MTISNSRELKTSQVLEDALNDYSWSPTKFAECIGNIHKTLQQTLVKTIVAVIKEIGSDSHSVYPRNRASHELCKSIVDSGLLDTYNLPMI